MSFSDLVQVLRWDTDGEAMFERIEARYLDVLGERLGQALAAICRSDPATGRALLRRVEDASAQDLPALLLAPATSRRLVTRLHGAEDVRDHLRAALGLVPAPVDATAGTLGGAVPVVFEPADDPRLPAVLSHAERALELLDDGCTPASAFVTRAMRRLVLRIDATRDGFASNSPQGLVGQAVLTNAHLPLVDDVVVAEALVHESTHGFVGMSEAVGLAGDRPQERWLRDDFFYDGHSCTVSPWTGKALDLPTYLHACFVWWGLLHLWAALAGSGLFEERRVRSRLLKAARGFQAGALVREILPYRDHLNTQLVKAFEEMAGEVDALLAETGLDAVLRRSAEGGT